MSTYRRKETFREQTMGDEIMVFDSGSDRVHVLNATSAFVWRCLEHPTPLKDIEVRLAETFDTSGTDDLSALVQRAVKQLVEKDLVERAGDET